MLKKKLIRYMLLCLILFLPASASSQLVNKFGVKGGAILTHISTPFETNDALKSIFENQTDAKYFLNFDIGVFAEIFDKPKFGVSVELHYNTKGESNYKTLKLLYPVENTSGHYKYQGVSDRFHYLSFQVLPRWRFELNSNDKLYFFGGPKVDFLIGNNNSDNLNEVHFDNFNPEFGLIAGIGNEVNDVFFLELKYEYSLSSIYTLNYGSESYGRKNSSFLLLMGVSFKKLFRMHF